MCDVEVHVGGGGCKPKPIVPEVAVVPKVVEEPKSEIDLIFEELQTPATLEGLVDSVKTEIEEAERVVEGTSVNYVLCGYVLCANSARRIALDSKAKYCGMCGHGTKVISAAPENVVTVERIVDREVPVYVDGGRIVNSELSRGEKYQENCRLIRDGKLSKLSSIARVFAEHLFDNLRPFFPDLVYTIPTYDIGEYDYNVVTVAMIDKKSRKKKRLFRGYVEIVEETKRDFLMISKTNSEVCLRVCEDSVLSIAEQVYEDFKRDAGIVKDFLKFSYEPMTKRSS